MDDILEKIKTGHTQELTEHLNTIDNTGNVKFMHEQEINRTISFLDMNIHHKEDGGIKITVYRKPTHRPVPPWDIRTPHSAQIFSGQNTLRTGQTHHALTLYHYPFLFSFFDFFVRPGHK